MIRFPLALYRVSGESMTPAYHPGDMVVGWRWYKPKVGQVVVVKVNDRLVIKRVTEFINNRVWLEGDNLEASTDSRVFGWLPASCLEAKALCINKDK
jgi:signal peptidase I